MRCWDWRLSVAVGVAVLAWAVPGMARPVADQTLGEERSQVIDRSARDFDVQGGARRGRNLFHSFQEFGVDEGGSVYFLNPDGVENIFSRVTGANRSDILGTLGVRGGANLFLMNPNGILFGQNASLDVQGSFVGTTANAIGFEDQGFFNATNPQAVPPGLLRVNPSAFLFNQVPVGNLAEITNQAGIGFGLRVGNRQNLLLLGGLVNNNGGNLSAFEGRVDIGAVAGGGIVGLNPDGSLNFPVSLIRGDITFTNGSTVDVTFNTAGDITVTGQNINISSGSFLKAGIDVDSGSKESQAGDLTLNATNSVTISDSFIRDDIFSGGQGNAGNLIIRARNLTVNSGEISASIFGSGKAGNLTIYVSDSVVLSGDLGTSIGPGGLFAQVEGTGTGHGGNLSLYTRHLSVSDGSKIQVATFGNGDAGNLFISASDVDVFNTARPRAYSTVINVGISRDSNIKQSPQGNGGSLTIETGQLNVRNGASVSADIEQGATGRGGNLIINARNLTVDSGNISASTFGAGDAGDLTIYATDSISLSGEIPNNRNGIGSPGGLFAQVETGATGRGGNLRIETGHLSISDGSKVQVGTFSQGNAGDLFIHASDVDVFNTSEPNYFTGIFAGVLQDPTSTVLPRGNGGSLTIAVNRLSIRDGARVTADVSGIGNGGEMLIQARDLLEVVGVSRSGNAPSTLGAEVAPQEVNTPVSPEAITGRGGDLTIQTEQLSVRGGGRVSVSTFGSGDAGNIDIQNAQMVNIIGQSFNNSPSFIRASVGEGANGRGGDITIETAQLSARNGGRVSASTSGTGSAGSIRVQGANSIVLNNGSISTAINDGAAADKPSAINLQTRSLSLANGADITASTSGQGNAGNITVRDANRVDLDRSTISSTVNSGAIGNGGSINIDTDLLDLDRANITASTQGQGRAGDVTVRDADRVSLNHSTISTEVGTTGIGQGGNIDIRTGSLNLDNHSNVTSSTSGQGDAGTITIRDADISLSNSSLSTAITGNSTGQGGSIRIRNGNSLTLNDRAQVSASNTARGNAGSLDLQLTGNLNANNSRITTSANGENASGGAIAITVDNIRLRNNSDLSTEVNRASGNGGDITLDANSIIAYDDSDIISRAGDRGGDIILNTPAFFGEGYQQNVNNSSPDGNDRVDLNANGRVSSGTIRTPNTDTIQNSLSDLPIGSIDSDRLIANSCIARTREGGTFLVTGSGGLADRPGNTTNSTYPTGEVRAVPINTETWQPGGAIVEPQGVYQLPDGRLVMSRECPQVPQ